MKLKTVVGNGILAALYIAVSMLIQPIAFYQVQFRISEMFNHLVAFNKKYAFGIILGVFLTNLFFSPMKGYDLIFGVGHSVVCMLIVIGLSHFIKNIRGRMIVTTIVFTFNMFIIAVELKLYYGFPFWLSWLTTAIGEFVVLLIGIPIMEYLNKRIQFSKLI